MSRQPPPPPFSLRWTTDLFGPVPVWSQPPHLPTIESLARHHLHVPHISACFFAAGAFNKLYTIAVPGSELEPSKSYLFRVTLPVEPFYKTASEVATLRYVREHTSIPVPAVIAYSSTAQNALGFEWILVEKLPGVSLAQGWGDWDWAAKRVVVESLGQYTRQLRAKCRFDAIGSLYHRAELGAEVLDNIVETDNPNFVIGQVVMIFFFAGKRRALVERDRGPYRHDRDYLQALTQVELEDMKLLQKLAVDKDGDGSEAPDRDEESDEDLVEDAPEIEELVKKLQTLLPSFFLCDAQPSSRPFVLRHHDLTHANILIDPATFQITGIVDWECITSVLPWEDTYPNFLSGPEVQIPPEPLTPGDTDPLRVERWENWEKSQLRDVFDHAVGYTAGHDGDAPVKRAFREQLDRVEFSPKMVNTWIAEHFGTDISAVDC